MLRTLIFSLVVLIGGCTASVGTLFIDRHIHSQEEMKSVPMGWPFTFVHQDLSGYTPLSWPQSFAFAQPQDNPVSVHLGWFAANVLVLSLSISAIFVGAVRLVRAATSATPRRRKDESSHT